MSVADDRPQRPIRGQGRDALIAATIEVISEKGLRGVTYRSVAERAGVTHGLVRHHFRTLPELVKTAVGEWASRSIGLTELEPKTGRLEDFAVELPDNVREHAAEHLAMYEITMVAVRSGQLLDEMRDAYRGYVAAVSRELDRIGLNGRQESLGRLVFAAIDGLVIQQLVLNEEGLLESGLECLHELLRSYAPPPV